MELVVIGFGVWFLLVAPAVAMCRVAARADARADGLYASERPAARNDDAHAGVRIRVPVL
jgi:hypothetical protein